MRVDGCMHEVVFSLYTPRVDGNLGDRSTRIALTPEIGSLAQLKDVISLVAGICKHGVDLARCGENLALFFPNHFSQILSDWVTSLELQADFLKIEPRS